MFLSVNLRQGNIFITTSQRPAGNAIYNKQNLTGFKNLLGLQ
jgi:hypothetical protein